MPGEKNPFQMFKENQPPPQEVSEELKERIKTLIDSSPVFLFMKGTPDVPMCGFSSNVVGILNSLNAPFKSFDILSDMEIRQGVKEYTNWPTFPQLYVKTKFVGGNDIVTELYESGELQKILSGEMSP